MAMKLPTEQALKDDFDLSYCSSTSEKDEDGKLVPLHPVQKAPPQGTPSSNKLD
jgi:hypothetical protein